MIVVVTIIQIFIECLLFARHDSKCFSYDNPLNPTNGPMRLGRITIFTETIPRYREVKKLTFSVKQ